jgi:Tol biopolymer transport system component
MRARRLATFVACAIALGWCGAPPARSQSYTIQQVDVSTSGVQGFGLSGNIHVSGDGRFVAFTSLASVLVPGDTNGKDDVFLRDLWAGTTERVSLGASGQQVSGASTGAGVSYDGRFVLFVSYAADVHPSDPEALGDVFVRDRLLGTTELISAPFDGSPSIYDCKFAAISGDGRYVAFAGFEDHFVPGDANACGDIFLRDRLLGTTQVVSVATDGTPADGHSNYPSISADGTRIVFLTKAKSFYPNTDDFWHVALRDVAAGTTQAVDVNALGQLANHGALADPTISPDGASIVFTSQATNLFPGFVGVFSPRAHLWRDGKPLEPVPIANGRPGGSVDYPSLSFDGRFLAFTGGGAWWIPGDPTPSEDILLQDTWLDVTQQVSSNGYAAPQNVQSQHCSMSWDGRVIAFRSYASNLVPGTTPNVNHAYVRISDPLDSGFVYCWPAKGAGGCQPRFSLTGTSSAGAGSGHALRIDQAPSGELGLLLYSVAGHHPKLTGMGWLCLTPPLRRMSVHATGGTPPPAADCTGTFAEDFNAWIATGQDPTLVPGTPVFVQGWVRDPSAAGGSLLSDAAAFFVGL